MGSQSKVSTATSLQNVLNLVRVDLDFTPVSKKHNNSSLTIYITCELFLGMHRENKDVVTSLLLAL